MKELEEVLFPWGIKARKPTKHGPPPRVECVLERKLKRQACSTAPFPSGRFLQGQNFCGAALLRTCTSKQSQPFLVPDDYAPPRSSPYR